MKIRRAAVALAAVLVLAGCGADEGEASDDPGVAETVEVVPDNTWVTGIVVDEQVVGTGDGPVWIAVIEVEGHRVGVTGSYCGGGGTALAQSTARLHAMAPVGTRLRFDPGGDAAVCPDELSILEGP